MVVGETDCVCKDPAPGKGRVPNSMASMRPTLTSNPHQDLPQNAYYYSALGPFKVSGRNETHCSCPVHGNSRALKEIEGPPHNPGRLRLCVLRSPP